MQHLHKKENIRIQVVDALNVDEVHKHIHEKLKTYNTQEVGAYDKQKFCFVCYENDELVAGLYAYLSLGNFYIDLLWVDEKFRGLGIGTKLLKVAEKHAMDSGALYIRVNTGSFQSPSFYLNNAYQQFAKLPITVPNKTEEYDYYFIKYLTENA